MGITKHWESVPLTARVFTFKNLRRSFAHIRDKGRRVSGSDGETPRLWMKKNKVHSKITELQADLLNGFYEPRDVVEAFIGSGNDKRKISILCLRDNVVARACYQVLSEVFDTRFHTFNFAYRPRRNRAQAAKLCQQFIRSGATHWVTTDISNCFGSIKRKRLKAVLKSVMPGEGDLLRVLNLFVDMEQNKRGIVQGGSLSPFYSNVYLDAIDEELAKNGLMFTHYGDDYAIGCRCESSANEARETIKEIASKIDLKLGEEKTAIVDVRINKLNFCGFQINQDSIGVNPQSVERMQKKAIREIDKYVDSGLHNELENLQQCSFYDYWFSIFPSREKAKNRFLDRNYSVRKKHGIVIPVFRAYIKDWLRSFEAVDDDRSLMDAIRPVFNYGKQKGVIG